MRFHLQFILHSGLLIQSIHIQCVEFWINRHWFFLVLCSKKQVFPKIYCFKNNIYFSLNSRFFTLFYNLWNLKKSIWFPNFENILQFLYANFYFYLHFPESKSQCESWHQILKFAHKMKK